MLAYTRPENLITAEIAKLYRQRENQLMDYLKSHKTNRIPDDLPFATNTNPQRSDLELREFNDKPPVVGETYGAYFVSSDEPYGNSDFLVNWGMAPMFRVKSISHLYRHFGRWNCRVIIAESLYHPGQLYRGILGQWELVNLRRIK